MREVQFGPFRFDTADRLLFVRGVPVDLGRRGAALLALLIGRRGEVVTKKALIDAAWGDAAIEDSNLSVQIGRLRKLLGSAEWIETVGRIGYRFPPEVAPTRNSARIVTRLVVPKAEALDIEGEGLVAGLTEDLVTALSRFRSLALSADVGSDPARYVLGASLRVAQGQLRIGIRLIDRNLNHIFWAERFDTAATRTLRVADSVIDAIAAQAEVQIQRAEIDDVLGNATPETAYALYQRGRALTLTNRPKENAEAIALFERALLLEPRNAAIAAAACDTRAIRISMGWPEAANGDVERCQELARDGLESSGEDATSRSMFGYGFYRSADRDHGHWVIQGAAEMNPNCVSTLIRAGTTNMHWGRIEQAEAQYRRALRLAPAHPEQSQVLGGLSRIRMMQGRFKEARIWAQKALTANENYGAAHWSRIAASALLGEMDAARDYLKAFRRAQPQVTVASVRSAQPSKQGRMTSTLEGLELAGLPA